MVKETSITYKNEKVKADKKQLTVQNPKNDIKRFGTRKE